MSQDVPSRVQALHQGFLAATRKHTAAEAELVQALVAVARAGVFRHYGYASIYDYARGEVQWEYGKTDAMLRMGRSLGELPKLRDAFARGEVQVTKVREMARCATPETEEAWLKLSGKPYAEIERLAASTSKGLPPGQLRPGETPRPILERPRWWLKKETVAVLEETIEAFRGEGSERLDLDAAILALVAAARRGKSVEPVEASEKKNGGTVKFDPRHRPWLLLTECPKCQEKGIQTREGVVTLSAEKQTVLAEDAVVIDPREIHRTVEQQENERPVPPHGGTSAPANGGRRKREGIPADTERFVFARGEFRCEIPGCTERKFLEIAHIRAHAKGGTEIHSNLCLTCWRCNEAERLGLIRLEGPYEKLRVLGRDGREITEMREIHRAVGLPDLEEDEFKGGWDDDEPPCGGEEGEDTS